MILINKFLFRIIAIGLFLLNTQSSCRNNQATQESVDCKCETIEVNMDCQSDSLLKVNDYVVCVNKQIDQIKTRELKNLSDNCSRAQIVACLLRRHPVIDSVRVTKSESGVSFHNKNNDSWSNLLID